METVNERMQMPRIFHKRGITLLKLVDTILLHLPLLTPTVTLSKPIKVQTWHEIQDDESDYIDRMTYARIIWSESKQFSYFCSSRNIIILR